MAYVMEDDPAASEHASSHLRGDYKNHGEEVQPGAPAFPAADPTSRRRNRLDLAHWIVAPENPLTARVAVNRFWQELFGRGIVTTSDDFGTQGDKPRILNCSTGLPPNSATRLEHEADA